MLSLSFLHLSDDDVLLLADALHKHSKLSVLGMGHNPFRPSIFAQFLHKVFAPSSKSRLYEIWVHDYQYHPMKQQLESYQTNQQQNGLPHINLKIVNFQEGFFKTALPEGVATANLDQSFLTGE